PGPRIEDVAMAHAVALDEALVVAARRDRARGHGQCREHVIALARMLDADAPRLAAGLRAEDREVAGEIDERALGAGLLQQQRGAIDRVLLAEAAKVDLHAGKREPHAPVAELDAVPADERHERGELRVAGHMAFVEAPRAPQDAGGRVE